MLRRLAELGFRRPRLHGVQNVGVDSRHCCRHGQAEIFVRAEIHLLERTVERSRQQRARNLDRHALADAWLPAGPAGVHQPAVNLVFGDELAQQVAVNRRMARQERVAKAGREGRRWFGDALHGAGDNRRIAGEEVIHRLRRIELGDGGQHAERIAGQHDDVFGVAAAPGFRCIRDEVDRIGDAGVFRLGIVVEVGLAGDGIENNVLHDRAEALACGVDFRLRLARKLDRLGVAAAFKIEDAFLAPAVLVVADEDAVRVLRQGCLARSGEAEEHSRIRAVARNVRRAMHRHHVMRGQLPVEEGEHGLLHLAGVARIGDEHDLAGEVERDDRLRARAVALGVGDKGRAIENGHVRHEIGEFGLLRADQQIADEQRVPRKFANDAGLDAQGRVGAAVQILHEHVLALAMLKHVGKQQVEMFRGHGLVDVPPDILVHDSVANGELVLRRTPGVYAGFGDDGAAGGDLGLVAANGLLIEHRRFKVVVDVIEALETEFIHAIRGVDDARLFHNSLRMRFRTPAALDRRPFPD